MYARPGEVEAARAAEDEVKTLIGRARGGDAAALPALRAALEVRPELWRSYGDLAAHARAAWVDLIGGGDLALKEALARTAAAMLEELAGPAAPPLERLLAGRVVATWLEVGYADATAARAAGAPLKQASFALKRQESAHRRYLTAIAALATVRRLLPPVSVEVEMDAGASGPAATTGPDVRSVGVDGASAEAAPATVSDGAEVPGEVLPFAPPPSARRRGRGRRAAGAS